MDGFLTNSNFTVPDIKDTPEIKNLKKRKEKPIKEKPIKVKPVKTKKIKEPKAPKTPRKPNILRSVIIGLLLFGLLAGSFMIYDKYKKGKIQLEDIKFLKFLNLNKSTQRDSNNNIAPPQNSNVNLPDSNKNPDQNST